jgi:CRP/FNR family transcriptional regulator, dissimilatory nitrate respiration regulator
MPVSPEALKETQLCRGLDSEDLAALGRIAAPIRCAGKKILFQEGDPSRGFYVLLHGKVRIYKASPDGQEYTLHIITPGQLFAEAAMFTAKTYPANAEVLEDAHMAFFPQEAFVRLLGEKPRISLKIIASLSHFVREFNRMVEELSLRDVPSRLAQFLRREARRQESRTVSLGMKKVELAERLGTVSETLSRTLRKLKEAGVIRENGGIVTVLDPGRLADIAEGIEKI